MILLIVGIALIVVGVAFAIYQRGDEAAGLQVFKVNISGASWLIIVSMGFAAIVGWWWFDTSHVNEDKEPPSSVLTSEPDPASFVDEEGPGDEPFTYGDDEALDQLWDECERGVMSSCDDLYQVSPLESDYEYFGGTCGLLDVEDPPEFCAEATSADF